MKLKVAGLSVQGADAGCSRKPRGEGTKIDRFALILHASNFAARSSVGKANVYRVIWKILRSNYRWHRGKEIEIVFSKFAERTSVRFKRRKLEHSRNFAG